ncbi:uncharacterized protein SPSK_04718 [Sporothrix schenckii 1099-18]|uniref:Uncharacterized protein n=1 Tax=Sporothrix schenckii 1099-18 TaxID=1397361 RepID=A0A0F2M3W6_SPOSC|nr:uncharacterized protein SPSK_04718 [Sporothrix schenckii 1099-18]KJR82861.1 hypothetical protein SPSK_04718 [Sporothrix schenckii 1099-18]
MAAAIVPTLLPPRAEIPNLLTKIRTDLISSSAGRLAPSPPMPGTAACVIQAKETHQAYLSIRLAVQPTTPPRGARDRHRFSPSWPRLGLIGVLVGSF